MLERESTYGIRVAVERDVESIAGLFRQAYPRTRGGPIHECEDPEFVRESMNRPDLWLVATVESRVVGCIAAVWHGWNRVYETCWGATDLAHRVRNIATDLRAACMKLLYARRDCELVMGYIRHTFLPIFENTNRGATVIGGHDGGMHVNNGSREAIFAGFTLNPEHTPRRIAPAETLPWAAFVKDEILKPLSLETITGAYPNTPIVGPPGTDYATDGNWRIDYRLAAEGESLHIVHILGSEERAKATDEGLAALLSVAPQKEHVFAYVLADKVALVRAMRKLGFQITAYLPAWHYTEHGRCDCLQVVRCTSPKTPTAPGLEQEVERFTRELNRGL